jgi:hypothetical protein
MRDSQVVVPINGGCGASEQSRPRDVEGNEVKVQAGQ